MQIDFRSWRGVFVSFDAPSNELGICVVISEASLTLGHSGVCNIM